MILKSYENYYKRKMGESVDEISMSPMDDEEMKFADENFDIEEDGEFDLLNKVTQKETV